MGVLPVVSGQKLMRALRRNGYRLLGSRGSHHALTHPDRPGMKLIIPVHGRKALKRGTLFSILRAADITPEELRKML